MRLKELTISTTYEAFSSIENILNELGALGISKEVFKDKPELTLKAYFEYLTLTEEKMNLLKHKINCLKEYSIDIGTAQILSKEVKEEDWANKWKENIKPVKITDKIVIKPTWEEYLRKDNEIIIEIDPGRAFGTGEHGTTSGCLEMLDKCFDERHSILDIGTGTGILAIAAAKLGATKSIKALDIDPIAIEVSKENALLNQVNKKIEFIEGDLLDVVEGEYDLVLANILPHVIIRLIPDLPKVLKVGGKVILSGIIEEKLPNIKEELKNYDFTIIETLQKGDWITILGSRRG